MSNNDGYFLIIIPIKRIKTQIEIMYEGAFLHPTTGCLPFSILSIPAIKNTIAIHEVAYTLQLYHIFVQDGKDVYGLGIAKGYTRNYMDYRMSTGDYMNYFWKWQWKIINNKKIP